jgi:hypothetical protein
MALINDPNVTAQIAALANSGTVDTNQIVSILNSVLPAGQQIATNTGGVTTGIYKRFGDFDKVNAKTEVVTTGLWSGDEGSMTQFYTSSRQVQSKSGYYYVDVYNKDTTLDESAEVQFSIAYGHVTGGGSMTLQNNDTALLATKATYAQYRSMLLEPGDTKFTFVNQSNSPQDCDAIYVINIARSRYREKMDAGNWSLKLSGSNGITTLIDESGKKFGDDLGLPGRVFRVASGSLNLGTEETASIKTTTGSNGEGLGLFYPDRGIIVLNASAIGSLVGDTRPQPLHQRPEPTNNLSVVVTGISGSLSGLVSTDSEKLNHYRLLSAMRDGVLATEKDFEARRTENISTQHYFVRATNREFNYSNNPTYTKVDGTFVETTFETDPQTFITTVGLLNDSNELIAVAKTSQPIVKSFDKEVLIKIKLSF